MKSLKKNIAGMLMLSIMLLFATDIFGQSTRKEKEKEKIAEVKKLIESKSFKFKARNASAMRGGSLIPLTSEYDVVITKDQVKSYLPYFGRAFVAPMNPSEGGIQFTSSDFTLAVTKRKKGRQDVIITPKDVRQARQMIFNISESGNATLLVSSNDRDPITFDGYITELGTR